MSNFSVITLFTSWYFALATIVSMGWVPLILSSVASIMAIINYYYQIKKNRTK
jgi:hypothetical protein